MTKPIAAALVAACAVASPAAAQHAATPAEVVAKIRQAAVYLEEKGDAGLADFERAESPFVWKDTYVFVLDCAADRNAAHPVPASRGITLSTLRDKAGKAFGQSMCQAAERPRGGWVEYLWPKPMAVDAGKADATGELTYAAEPSRKVTFMLSVPGQPYQVGAGIYDRTLTIEQLDGLLD